LKYHARYRMALSFGIISTPFKLLVLAARLGVYVISKASVSFNL